MPPLLFRYLLVNVRLQRGHLPMYRWWRGVECQVVYILLYFLRVACLLLSRNPSLTEQPGNTGVNTRILKGSFTIFVGRLCWCDISYWLRWWSCENRMEGMWLNSRPIVAWVTSSLQVMPAYPAQVFKADFCIFFAMKVVDETYLEPSGL